MPTPEKTAYGHKKRLLIRSRLTNFEIPLKFLYSGRIVRKKAIAVDRQINMLGSSRHAQFKDGVCRANSKINAVRIDDLLLVDVDVNGSSD